jgi:rSAM/selenodomain-associated transferase 1
MNLDTENSENLLLIFVKNLEVGKVKTRLAYSIGNQAAFEVYEHLLNLTEEISLSFKNCTIHVYFSDFIDEKRWKNQEKFIQCRGDLGAKMKDAFQNGFSLGFQRIICIGSDLPDLSKPLIHQAFEELKQVDTVFGPANDGGYYLIGLKQVHSFIFENKSWSTEDLFKETLEELENNQIKFQLLENLNDIDTLEDLQNSNLALHFSHYLNA